MKGVSSLVTIVVDIDEVEWDTVTENSRGSVATPISLSGVLNSLVVFLNTVKLINYENEVAVIAECPDGSARLVLDRLKRNHSEELGMNLKQLSREISKSKRQRTSSLALSLSKALCYSNRVVVDHKRRFGVEPLARVLVVQASADNPSQYVASMNAAFAAQKRGVIIDVCDFHAKGSTILQQVSHLSGGIMQHYDSISSAEFTEYLLSVFLSDTKDRAVLRLPPKAPIVLEAACFCHQELKSRGFVCSVCLSVFCKNPSTQGAHCPVCKTRVQTI